MSLLLAMALSVAPGSSGVRVDWTAPAGCPDAAAVQGELDRLLAGRPVAGEIVADAAVEAAPEGLRATVRIADGAPRSLHAGECATLARAVALVIAVAVDPVALAGRIEVPDDAPPGPPEPVEPPPPEPLVVAPPPAALAAPGASLDALAPPEAAEPAAPPPAIRHGLALRGGVLSGVAPAVTGAVAASYLLDRGPLRLEARALYAAPRRLRYPDGVGARLQAVTVGVLACAAPERRWLRAPICAGVEGGPVIGVGEGSATVERRATLWASALMGAALVARVHPRIALTLGGELGIALRRPAFHVGEREILSRAPQVGGRGLAGVEIRLR